MTGAILLYMAFTASLISFLAYLLASWKFEGLKKIGRYSFLLTVSGILAVSAYLMVNVLNKNYQFTYIWQYSSNELSMWLRYASFYSGQEGSFLLWVLLISVAGLLALPFAIKKGYEAEAYFPFSLVIAFILLLLLMKSPFVYVWETFASEGVKAGFTPPNGRGLNPILQNYWITIHPPILFSGFAAMTVPYCFAIAGLIKRDYKGWLGAAIPLNLIAAGILGLGIMLGGLWAYETLGWGGFWGWDPVENASLLPWLVSAALVHTLLVQRRTGGLVKTNFALAITGFMLVLYSTFLTRSGVLGDSSVHSFVDPGRTVYLMLVLFIAAFGIIGLFLILYRLRDMNLAKLDFGLLSKEFALSLGSLFLLAIALVVFLGTSLPMITELLNMPKSSVEISFYDRWNLPIAVLLMLVNALSMYLGWKSRTAPILKSKIIVPLILSAVVTILIIVFRGAELENIFLIFASLMAVFVNFEQIYSRFKRKKFRAGAFTAHIGAGFLLLGAVGSGAYSHTEHISLKFGEQGYALGYSFKYASREQIETNYKDREKYKLHLQVKSGAGNNTVSPIIYWSDFNNRESPFLEPGIKVGMFEDLYISPKSLEVDRQLPRILLSKNKAENIPNQEGMKMELLNFDMSRATALDSSSVFMLDMIVKLYFDQKTSIDTLTAMFDMSTLHCEPVWKQIPETDFEAGFVSFFPDMQNMSASKAITAFKTIGEPEPEPIEIFTFDASVKPMIWLVWLGSALIFIGFIWSAFKYKNQKI